MKQKSLIVALAAVIACGSATTQAGFFTRLLNGTKRVLYGTAATTTPKRTSFFHRVGSVGTAVVLAYGISRRSPEIYATAQVCASEDMGNAWKSWPQRSQETEDKIQKSWYKHCGEFRLLYPSYKTCIFGQIYNMLHPKSPAPEATPAPAPQPASIPEADTTKASE